MGFTLCALPLVLALPAISTAQPGCPALEPFTPPAKISPQDKVFRFQGGFIAIVHELRIDSDGSPVAYHPENLGTTHLCNGLDPYVGGKCISDKDPKTSPCYAALKSAISMGWERDQSPPFCIYGFVAPATKDPVTGKPAWGGPFGAGPIPRQPASAAAPGFFVSTTALTNPGFQNDDQRRYFDADKVSYVVVPGVLVRKRDLHAGGIAWAWNPRTGRRAAAVIGDTQSKFGEVSVALAQLIEKGRLDPIPLEAVTGSAAAPWPYARTKSGRVRLVGNPKGPVVFVYFSNPPATASADSAAAILLNSIGGEDHLKACLKPHLP
jgi:hypothetical protein